MHKMRSMGKLMALFLLIPTILLSALAASLYFTPNYDDPKLDEEAIPKFLRSELIYKRYVSDIDRFYVYKLSGQLDSADESKWQNFTVKYREFIKEIRLQAKAYIDNKVLFKEVDDFLFYRIVRENGAYLFPTENRKIIYLPEEKVGYLFFYTH